MSSALNVGFWLAAWILVSLPWRNAQCFGIYGHWSANQASSAHKALWLTALESLTLYALAFGVMFALESQQGQRTSQQWQFWAIAVCLWVVLAFPAAAWHKLRKH